MKRPSSIKQGGSNSEVIICFGTKFKLSADLTVRESYNGFGIYLTTTCVIVQRYRSQIYLFRSSHWYTSRYFVCLINE